LKAIDIKCVTVNHLLS